MSTTMSWPKSPSFAARTTGNWPYGTSPAACRFRAGTTPDAGGSDPLAAIRSITGKANRTFIIVLSPLVQIPPEPEKAFVVLDHDLPGREQLEQIARSIATKEIAFMVGDSAASQLEQIARSIATKEGVAGGQFALFQVPFAGTFQVKTGAAFVGNAQRAAATATATTASAWARSQRLARDPALRQ